MSASADLWWYGRHSGRSKSAWHEKPMKSSSANLYLVARHRQTHTFFAAIIKHEWKVKSIPFLPRDRKAIHRWTWNRNEKFNTNSAVFTCIQVTHSSICMCFYSLWYLHFDWIYSSIFDEGWTSTEKEPGQTIYTRHSNTNDYRSTKKNKRTNQVQKKWKQTSTATTHHHHQYLMNVISKSIRAFVS